MRFPTRPIVAKPLIQLLLVAAITGATTAGDRPSVAPETFSGERGWWNQPSTFVLEARTVEHDGAFGAHFVRPVLSRGQSDVLVEAYGFEGEERLGIAGGGVVYRRALGSRGGFEVSAFFEGLRSTDGFSYPQLGAGVAYSPDRWITLRGNGYLPLRGKDRRHDGTERWAESEGSGADRREVSLSRERFSERAPMRGFDMEAELRLPNPPRWVDPRLAIGYAYREAEDRPEVYAGRSCAESCTLPGTGWSRPNGGTTRTGRQEWRVGVKFQMLSVGRRKPTVAAVKSGICP
jgi:hypothetical protein